MNKDAIYHAQRRGASNAVRGRVKGVADELMSTGTLHDPPRSHMLETRRAVVAAWTKTADQLDAQGKTILAGEVRSFSRHLPPVLTDRERPAAQFLQHRASRRATAQAVGANTRQRDDPLTG
jgi:hypothetical protein